MGEGTIRPNTPAPMMRIELGGWWEEGGKGIGMSSAVGCEVDKRSGHGESFRDAVGRWRHGVLYFHCAIAKREDESKMKQLISIWELKGRERAGMLIGGT